MQHETHAAEISIHLIGRFRITSGDRVAIDGAWPRRKPLALVKLLALQPNRSLHRDVIFDASWPDLSPTAAGNNLRQSLHQLRNALAEAGLAAPMVRSVGDSLAIAPEIDIDLERFRAAAEQARAVRTDTAAYDRALKLCAGDLLPDDQYEPWVERDRADVQTLQTQLLMELSRLHLARRDTEQAEGCFRRVVAADPANEEAHRALMHLYAQTGLRTRALRQYDRCRDALEEELGVKPSEETLEVAQEILRGRTSASVSGASGRDTPFVGRQRELDTLCSYVDEGLAGNGRVVLVGGEPGVGKTRAAEELATYARMRGALVCWGRCYDAEGAPAYWPWSQVVREYVEGRDGSEVRDVVGTAVPNSPRSSRNCGTRWRVRSKPSRRPTRSRRDSACSRPWQRSSRTSRGDVRSSSSSTISIPPIRRRSCCCASSHARSATRASLSSPRIGTPSYAAISHSVTRWPLSFASLSSVALRSQG
jgi:DNA-binding SARP family transcriptional activator